MKKILISIAAIMVLGSFAMPETAEAIYVEITDLTVFTSGVTYSDDSNESGEPTTFAYAAPTGSISIGAAADPSDHQPEGIYGVGVPLAPLGLTSGYNIAFDINFSTYDSSTYDTFDAVITQGDFLWDGGTVKGGYTWGGIDATGIEYNFDVTWAKRATVMVTPASDYFVNVLIQTRDDNDHPSWGTFSDFAVAPVPEPTSMLLLGIGLIGLAGGKIRKRFKA